MKKKKKVLFIYIVIAIIIIIGGIFYYYNFVKNNNPIVYNERVKEKKYKDLVLSNIEIAENMDLKHLYIVVTNNGDKDFKREYLKFTFKDKNNKVIDTMGIMIPSISKGESTRLDIVIEYKIKEFYDFDITKVN